MRSLLGLPDELCHVFSRRRWECCDLVSVCWVIGCDLVGSICMYMRILQDFACPSWAAGKASAFDANLTPSSRNAHSASAGLSHLKGTTRSFDVDDKYWTSFATRKAARRASRGARYASMNRRRSDRPIASFCTQAEAGKRVEEEESTGFCHSAGKVHRQL